MCQLQFPGNIPFVPVLFYRTTRPAPVLLPDSADRSLLEARPHSVVYLYGAANDFIGQVVFFRNESKNNKTSSITHPDNSAILQILIQTIFNGILSRRLRITSFTSYFGTCATTRKDSRGSDGTTGGLIIMFVQNLLPIFLNKPHIQGAGRFINTITRL